MKNKLPIIGLYIGLALSLVACGNNAEDDKNSVDVKEVDEISEDESAVKYILMSESYGGFVGEEKTFLLTFEAEKMQEEAVLYADDELSGKFNDGGIDGDEIANDGIFSCEIVVNTDKEKTIDYVAEVGAVKSSHVQYRVVEKPSDEEINETISAMESIDSKILSEQGNAEKIYAYVEELKANGTIVDMYKTDYGFKARFNTGMWYIYAKSNPETSAGRATNDMTIISAQPFKTEFANRNKDTEAIDQRATDGVAGNIVNVFENCSFDYNLDNEAVTLDVIRAFGPNEIILWSGHGLYDTQLGPCLLTGDLYKENANYDYDEVYYCSSDEGYGNCLITPSFVKKNVGDMAGSFLYLDSCSSYRDGRLVSKFCDKGVAALVGNTDVINTIYCLSVMETTVNKMLEVNENSGNYNTLGEALTYAKSIHGEKDSFLYSDEGAKDYAMAKIAIGENYRLADVEQFAENTVEDLKDGWYVIGINQQKGGETDQFQRMDGISVMELPCGSVEMAGSEIVFNGSLGYLESVKDKLGYDLDNIQIGDVYHGEFAFDTSALDYADMLIDRVNMCTPDSWYVEARVVKIYIKVMNGNIVSYSITGLDG